MKNFYSHLINYEELIDEMEKLSLEKNHKKELCDLIDKLVHNLVLDITLSKLGHDEKVDFLKMLETEISIDLIMEFLNKKIKDYDTILKFEIDKLKIELLEDIKQSQNISSKF